MVRLAPIEQTQQVINHVPTQTTNNNNSNCNSPVSNNGENMMQQQSTAPATSSVQQVGGPQTSPDSGVSLPSSPPLIEHTSPPPPPTIIPCAIHQPQGLQPGHNHPSLMIAAINHQGHPIHPGHHHHHPRHNIPPPSHQPHENGHGNSGGSNTPNGSPNNGATGNSQQPNSAPPTTPGSIYIQYHPEYYHPEHGYYIHHHHPDIQPAICTMPSEYGPAAVQMVSQNRAPPMQVPVQVPPGQVMQQYDGNITHLILSPTQFLPAAPAPGQRGVQQMHAPFIPNLPNSHYYNVATGYPPPGPGGNPHYHQLSGNHLQPQQQISHSPSPPNSYHKDDQRNQRQQHVKVLRQQRDINSTMSTPAHSPSPRKHDLNGHYHHNNNHRRMNGASSVGTSEDGEESSSVPDDEDECNMIKDLLSGIQSPSVTDISSRTATLKWEIPPVPETLVNIHELRYDVLLSDNRNNIGTYKKIFQGASRVCMIRDLKPNQDYEVRLQAHFDKLVGDASDATKFRTPSCEPDQPKPPKLVNSTKNSLHLRWVQPCDNGSSITHYILEYGEHKMISITIKARNQYNLQKLQPATLYNVRLLAFNKNGPSVFSEIVQYATTGKPPPPMPNPPGLQLATSTTLRLFWDRQSQDERYMLQMYDVHSRRYNCLYNGSNTFYECCNLQRSTDYKFRLRADNEYGSSDWSAEVTYRTAFDRPGRPSKPQVKGKIQGEFFRAKWEPPTDRVMTQADIKLYHLEISSGGKFERIYSGPEPEAICDRLSPGTTYQIRVSCEGPGGQLSNYSDVSTVTTEAIAPGQPEPPRAIDIQPYAAKLNWSPPNYNGGAPVLEYEVQLCGSLIYRGKENTCIAQDLIPGEWYEAFVRAVNRIGAGQWSDMFRFQSSAAPPDAPEIDEIIVKSATHMIVTWKKPNENGDPIREYHLESSCEDPEKSNFEVIYQGVQTSTDIRNLLPHTLYNFRLKAANSAGFSKYSPVITTQTFAAVPSAPQISKSDISDTEVTLNWSEPDSNGSDILHYNIEFADQSLTTDGFLTEYKITNLLPETSYKFKIQAVNSIGSGPFSNTLKLQTLPPAPTPPNLESPGVGHNFIKLKWGEGKNVDFTKFTVEMFVQRAKDFQIVYSGTNYVCKVTKLQEQTEYTFRIKAGNDRAGTGKYSENYTFKTAAAMPSTVKSQTFSFDRINIVPQASTIGGSQQLTTGGSSVAYGGLGVVVHISWQASKYSDPKVTDPIEYIVQCSLEKDSAFTEIYRGLQTKCSIDFLVPGSSYFVRICPIRIMMNGGVGSNLKGQFSTPQRLDVPQLSEIKNSLNSQCLSSFTTMGTIISGGTPSHQNYNQHQSVFAANSSNSSNTNSTTGGTVGGLGTGSGTAISSLSSNHHPHNNLRQRSSSCGISPSYNTNQQHQFQKDLVANVSSSSTFGRNFLDVNPFSGKQPLQNLVNYNYHNNLNNNNNQSHVNNNNNNNNNLNGNFGAIKRLYGKLTAFYSKNRRRFTDTQKAVIWMLSFLFLAFCCAAFLKLFLS